MALIRGTASRNNIDGTDDDDVIYGFGGNDVIDGDRGNDRIFGGVGNDVLDGDNGNDRLFGQGGADRLEGDLGNDVLFGGGGADRFRFEAREGRDTIGDFQNGLDRIVFDIDNLNFNDLTIRGNGRGDTVVTYAATNATIILDDINPGTITRADFVFDL